MAARYAFAGDVGEYRLYRLGMSSGRPPGAGASDTTTAVASQALSAGWDGARGVSIESESLLGALLLIPILAGAFVHERRRTS